MIFKNLNFSLPLRSLKKIYKYDYEKHIFLNQNFIIHDPLAGFFRVGPIRVYGENAYNL